MTKLAEQRARRAKRTRIKLRSSAHPRLSVARSLRHISVQVIDDKKRETLAWASSLDKALGLSKTSSVEAAKVVGKAIAERAREAGVKKVVFDRGAWIYHGRIKALAEAARENGLEF
jgi:large subunit ribosomal protein L18